MDQSPNAKPSRGLVWCRLLGGLAATLFLLLTFAPSPLARPRSAPELWQHAQAETQADSAAVLLRRLIEEFPRHDLARKARLTLADYYFARGDYPLARVFYHRASEEKQGSGRATLGEARSYYALGDYSTARNVVRPVVQSDEPALSWSASFLVALSWQAEGQAEEADAVYRRLLARSPGPAQPAALLAAARVAIALGNEESADDLLLRLRSQYPESPEAVEARDLDQRKRMPEDPGS
jgi:TolA-binding protein